VRGSIGRATMLRFPRVNVARERGRTHAPFLWAISPRGRGVCRARQGVISAREDETHGERQQSSQASPRSGSEPGAMPPHPQTECNQGAAGKNEHNRGIRWEFAYPLPQGHDVTDFARETPLSRGREAWRLPASAKAVATTRKRGIAISKVTAKRSRARKKSLPSPMPRTRCPDTENSCWCSFMDIRLGPAQRASNPRPMDAAFRRRKSALARVGGIYRRMRTNRRHCMNQPWLTISD
jgi:hypothetical protein